MKSKSMIRIANIIVSVLMLALIVMLFMPYWHTGTQSVSINGYTWMPDNYPELQEYFVEDAIDKGLLEVDDPNDYVVEDEAKLLINGIVTAPVMILVLGVLTVVMCCIKSKSVFASVVALVTGGIGGYRFATNAQLAYGSLHTVMLVLLIAAAVVGLAGVVIAIVAKAKKSLAAR